MWYFSPAVRGDAANPTALWRASASATARGGQDELEFPVVVAQASEMLDGDAWRLPSAAITSDTRYLIVADVPVPALIRLSSLFDLRRPEQRMHVTTDRRAIARVLIARCRDVPWEGIVDAYLVGRTLHLLQGDFSFRSFPVDAVPSLRDMDTEALGHFELDEDGSFLYWPAADLHLGASQLLQAVDPSYLAEVEVRRYPASAATGALIADLRENRGLRQRDIEGLSERHVRRIEQGIARLTGDSAAKLARAFGLELHEFLLQIATALAAERSADVGITA
jgi:hypothetical protein